MKKLLILILAFLLFFGGCDKKDKNNEVIKIGALLALTGSASSWGNNCKNGIDLAVNELNFDKNIKYKIIYQDSKGEAKTAISAFHKLKNEKVKFIIGDVSSSVNLAIAPLADKEKIIVISPAATSPKLTKAGEYTFRTWNSDTEEAITMANYCKENSLNNIALLLINNDYGIGLKNSFIEKLKGTNVKIDNIIFFEPNTKDFKLYLSKIKKETEALYIVGYPNELHSLFKAIHELNKKQILLGTSVFDDPILKNMNLKNQIFYSSPAKVDNKNANNFTKNFKKYYHTEPSIASDTAYDAMFIIDKVISNSNVLKSMYNIKEYEGASGIISFDKNGDVHKPMKIKKY